jgi:hypothetical protein
MGDDAWVSSDERRGDDSAGGTPCAVITEDGVVVLLRGVAGAWSGEGPAGRGHGDIPAVLRACAVDPDPEWVAAIDAALAVETARGHGGGRTGLVVRRGTDAPRLHVTRSANRESVRRHGLDPARMTRPGIAGSETPEWDGIFVAGEDEAAWFRSFVQEETDVWAVDVRGLWLVSDPACSGGFDQAWAIVPGRIGPERLALAVAGGDGVVAGDGGAGSDARAGGDAARGSDVDGRSNGRGGPLASRKSP